MKKLVLVLLLLLTVMLTGCDSGHCEDREIEIVDKYTAVESKYNWFLESYKTYTAYYLVLENGDIEEVNNSTYAKYQVGDLYTVSVWVANNEEEKE